MFLYQVLDINFCNRLIPPKKIPNKANPDESILTPNSRKNYHQLKKQSSSSRIEMPTALSKP